MTESSACPRVDELVLIAGGGHAAELASYLADLAAVGEGVHLLGVLDDGKAPGPWLDSEVLGPIESLRQILSSKRGARLGFLTAVGSNELRRKLVERVEGLGGDAVFPWTLRHPTAHIGSRVEIGPGTC